jgi:hypothetical protein
MQDARVCFVEAGVARIARVLLAFFFLFFLVIVVAA